MNRSGASSTPCEQPAQPFRLAPPLLGQRPLGVVAMPALGVAGVGVAEQVEGDHPAIIPAARPSARADVTLGERQELVDPLPHALEDGPEGDQPLLLGALGLGRIRGSPSASTPRRRGRPGTRRGASSQTVIT